MKFLKLVFAPSLFLVLGFILFHPRFATAQSNQYAAREREKNLSEARSASDSLRILLDVYTLSDNLNRERVRSQILRLASKTDNHEVISEVINELSASTDDANSLARLIEISENLPKNSNRETLQTLLQMEQAKAEVTNLHDSQIENRMEDYIRQGLSLTGDPYQEIQNIYRAMVYLGASSQGPLYFEYITRLEELVDNLPPEEHAIRNLFYTTAALFYTRKRDYDKAIELDRKLIKELDAIKDIYEKEGKSTDELNYFYYVSNRRMLRNFRGLSPDELEQAFNNCVELAQINERAKEEFGTGGLAKSYYYYAKQDYEKAAPELKKALNHPEISDFRKTELLGLLAYAMRQTGDKNGELETLRQYTSMLQADRAAIRDDMYREIELRNSANKLIADEYIQQEKQHQQNRVMRQTSITLVYVLALLLIFMAQAYFRQRNKLKELELKNNKLRRNIEDIFDDGVPKGARDLHHHKNRLKG